MAKHHDQTGRSKSKKSPKHVRLYLSMKESDAWKNLSITARMALIEVNFLYDGLNNGRLAISARKLGEEIGVSKSSAARSIGDLVKWGFLEQVKASSFSMKRIAAEYRLTHLKCDVTGAPPSHRYQRTGKGALRLVDAAE